MMKNMPLQLSVPIHRKTNLTLMKEIVSKTKDFKPRITVSAILSQ